MTFPEWVQGSGGETASFLLFFPVMFVFIVLERFVAQRKRAPHRPRRWLTNYAFVVANTAIFSVAPGLSTASAYWAQRHHIGLLNQVALPAWAVLVVTWIVRGFAFWLIHVLSHKVPLFWRLHRVHHMDTDVDVSTTERIHFLEGFMGAGLNLPFTLLFGLSPWVIITYELVQLPIVLFSHANIRVPERVDRILRLIIQTPSLHRLHHSSTREETDSNYGDMFSFWDMLFGTYRTRPYAELSTMELGLEEVRDGRARNFFWLTVSPFVSLVPRTESGSGNCEAVAGEKMRGGVIFKAALGEAERTVANMNIGSGGPRERSQALRSVRA